MACLSKFAKDAGTTQLRLQPTVEFVDTPGTGAARCKDFTAALSRRGVSHPPWSRTRLFLLEQEIRYKTPQQNTNVNQGPSAVTRPLDKLLKHFDERLRSRACDATKHGRCDTLVLATTLRTYRPGFMSCQNDEQSLTVRAALLKQNVSKTHLPSKSCPACLNHGVALVVHYDALGVAQRVPRTTRATQR